MEGGEARGDLRLRVLNALPVSHQRYLAQEIRKLCIYYIRSKSVSDSDISPEELLSEVWKKLLGSISLNADESLSFPQPSQWTVNLEVPEHDGRIVWLIKEIGGSEALAHRHQDILRQRFGRKYQFVQPTEDEDNPFENDGGSHSEVDSILYEADIRRIWRGLLIAAAKQFPPDDDVSMLLRVIEADPAIFDESPGSQWPINEILMLLSIRFRNHPWTVQRVDNAKRRLTKWIRRLMQSNGLDSTDLEAVFAQISRQNELQVTKTNYFPKNQLD
jgi:hypothetical protein